MLPGKLTQNIRQWIHCYAQKLYCTIAVEVTFQPGKSKLSIQRGRDWLFRPRSCSLRLPPSYTTLIHHVYMNAKRSFSDL
jgi:hypothetical protein